MTPTVTVPRYSVMPPSLSNTFPPTPTDPVEGGAVHVAVLVGDGAPYEPEPQSNAYVKPAASSASDGSSGEVSESTNGRPASADGGELNVAVGGPFVMFTVVVETPERPPGSVACTLIVREPG